MKHTYRPVPNPPPPDSVDELIASLDALMIQVEPWRYWDKIYDRMRTDRTLRKTQRTWE